MRDVLAGVVTANGSNCPRPKMESYRGPTAETGVEMTRYVGRGDIEGGGRQETGDRRQETEDRRFGSEVGFTPKG